MPFSFVGQFLKMTEVKNYLDALHFGEWKPGFVTLHHTASPSLSQRPQGLSPAHISNLRDYYRDEKGWSAGPHAFVDDRGVWVFSRWSARGVHAVSFNKDSWGVEMLGDFDNESFDTGRGAQVRDNAVLLLSLMCQRLFVKADTLRFHRDDPLTTKTCPGMHVSKEDMVARVGALMATPAWHIDIHRADKSVQPFTETLVQSGSVLVPARAFLAALIGADPGNALQWDSVQQILKLNGNTVEKSTQIGGRSFASVRNLSEMQGYTLTVDSATRIIHIHKAL